MIVRAVTTVDFDNGVVTVVFDPEAHGIATDAMLSTSPFDNFAEFAGLPIGWATEEAEHLRTAVGCVETQLADGTSLGSMTTAELYEIATGEKLD